MTLHNGAVAAGFSPVCCWRRRLRQSLLKGDKPSLRSATWILAIVAFSAFVLSSLVSVLDMLGWVQTFVATDFAARHLVR